jgi:hypothetical protein
MRFGRFDLLLKIILNISNDGETMAAFGGSSRFLTGTGMG